VNKITIGWHSSNDPSERKFLFSTTEVRVASQSIFLLSGEQIHWSGSGRDDRPADPIAFRETVCDRLSWFGIDTDPVINQETRGGEEVAIGSAKSSIGIYVIPTKKSC
jgi:hypothetical protein